MNVIELLRRRASAAPDVPAIIDARGRANRVLSFADLDDASARAAGWLHAAGLRPGDGVLVLLPMSAELYVALLAAFRLGLVALIVDPSAGRAHVERCCALYPPQALIASDRAHLLRLFSPALRDIRLKVSVGFPVPGAASWRCVARSPRSPVVHPGDPETPALLTFTSGSTGRPKAAVRSHGFLRAQGRAIRQTLELKPGDVDVATLPVFVLANLASGVTSVIPDVDLRHPASIRPGRLAAQIRAYRATRLAASPALVERLAEYCGRHNVTLPSLRRVIIGGGPVFPRVWSALYRVAPGTEIAAVYGSTEAEPIALMTPGALNPADREERDRGRGVPAGFPVPTIRLRILHDRWGKPVGPFTEVEFAAACLPPGEVGEIVVSGAHVLAGYLHGHGNAENKFAVDGTPWHRTGDAGYLDPRGRLWLLGRCAARIDDAHGRVYPLGVEGTALRHPDVRRAAFVGHRGRRVLVLELRRGASVPDLTGLSKDLHWAGVDEIRLHPRIPVDARHNAKVDHGAVAARLNRQSGLSRLVAWRRASRPAAHGSRIHLTPETARRDPSCG